ncbi:DeoR/GlpR family DNA-binding transcription regulator [Niallia taxi]|uniref:DeoR/GlpR transcriptional regulator n=1 Tax=Niallia taxi TaxID=2499688 RepID=A0A437K5R6_9BACI|nr:DeoR/GlpR family DNA-binding transcription regulator [Niallia taxi]MDE5053189.1 DeoR/GlpR family DNA-binding transcription regulator [Niallia taxi]MDK8640903.1 DeoR/GlpR family DNA-binding transcription regulator [Niallia taxi]MED4052829.1 DeoR/GlpR family DNA-binding transcription regulator [Niallia taxi]MED4120184.1 DeoR/GlpR family DNA-binding transcription regulator [Niallia taxi]RVT58350.1 DeoR/GlpR transcriptional regulator [Niallia taxi]
MLVAERRRKIVELVNERLSIRVSELSDIFSVTEETIRRDLEKLEQDQLLSRSHGGAVSIEKEATDVPFVVREITNSDEKKAIAAEAVKWIEPGEQIVLDASTTAWYMAQELPDMPLTVITNSIKVALELSKKEQIKVISTGGMLLANSLSYVGPLSERSLDSYYVNKLFLSCKGVHLSGLSDSNEWQAILKKKMMDIASQVILLADSSKFGVKTFAHISELTRIHHVISDSNIPAEFHKELQEKAIPVTIVKI